MELNETTTAPAAPDIVDKLQQRIDKVNGWIKSSLLVADLLQPEMDKFEARTGHDIYTVRMAVDHRSSVRTQQREVDDLVEAKNEIMRLRSALQREHYEGKIDG